MTASPRVAVFGAGHWGKNIVRNMHELGALAAVVDGFVPTRAAMRSAYPLAAVGDDADAVLADPSIEAVALATPAETHFALAKRALLAGKHVYVEKPLALTFTEGRELVDLAESAGRILFVGHLLEYHGAVQKLDAMVQAGELGTVRTVTSNRLSLGKIRSEENVLWSFAPHDLSLILRLLREMPETVGTTGGAFVQPHIQDYAITALQFGSGARAHVYANWLHPFKEHKLVVVGTEGMAVFDDTQPAETKLMWYASTAEASATGVAVHKGEGIPVAYAHSEPLKAECGAFLEAVSTGVRPLTDGYNGLRVLRVLQAAQESMAAQGQPVRIAETYSQLSAPNP